MPSSLPARIPAVSPSNAPSNRFAQTHGVRPEQKKSPMRRYQVAYLNAEGQPEFTDRVGPALPKFEAAFSAFSRGTLISTSRGRVAVEDLEPGAEILTNDHGPLPLMWVGSMTLIPQGPGLNPQFCKLTRVMPEAFGIGRPETNLMAGPGARLLARPEGLRDSMGGDRILSPARDLIDGINVFEVTPQRPVSVYHICLDRHAIIKAAGIDMETYHPGNGFERTMGHNALTLFMGLFPHLTRPGGFGGTQHTRLPIESM